MTAMTTAMTRHAVRRSVRRWLRLPLGAVLAATCGLFPASTARAWSPAGDGEPARLDEITEALRQRQQRTAAVERGRRLFAGACAACHGREGRGDGPAADRLVPPPRDLTASAFRFRTTPSGAPPRDADLKRTIRRGVPASAMPAFRGTLDEEQLDDVVAFLRTIGPGRPEVEPVELAPVPEADARALRDGRALYLALGCWRCHGIGGDGRGPSAAGLTDTEGRPLGSTDLRYDPLKGGREPEDVVRTLRTGLNGAPMPSYDEAMLLSRDAPTDSEAIADRLSDEDRQAIEGLLAAAPARAELQAMAPSARDELRDDRLAALAHYVLSLDRRRGVLFRLFRQQPEREPQPAPPDPPGEPRASAEDFWSEDGTP